MELNGARILIDGLNLELSQGSGIKTYAISLIKAYKELGANPSVLISKYSLKDDKDINTNILALFQEMTFKTRIRYNYPLVFNTLFGLSSKSRLTKFNKDLIITDKAGGFSFINDVNIYVSRDCYNIADYLRYFGFRTKINPVPKVDIWHTTYFTPIKVKKALRVSTIHDIVPLRLPQTTTNDKGIFVKQIKDVIKQSQLILCVSHHTKTDILNNFDVNPERLFVTYQPVLIRNEGLGIETDSQNKDNNINLTDVLVSTLRTYDLKYRQYILFVGSIEPKKNLRRLIQAYLSLDTDIPLIIAGKKAWLWESELAQLDETWNKKKIEKRIRLLEYLPFSDLSALYKGAMFLAFPSLYEGFGLPPVEAMTIGLPVLTSNESSLPEVCGDAALYVNPYDTRDIADKITMMINDKELREGLILKGLERAKYFNMDMYKHRLKTAYNMI